MSDLDPRRALMVRRYHTWPHNREQSVGEHSAQVMRVLLAIWPDAPRQLLVHCLTHDVGELRAGDPPYPAKKINPQLAAGHAAVERGAHLEMCLPWGLPAPLSLNKWERLVFKLAEFIEMWEWALDEMVCHGNDAAKLVAVRCRIVIDTHLSDTDIPLEVRAAAKSYIRRREQHTQRVRDGEA